MSQGLANMKLFLTHREQAFSIFHNTQTDQFEMYIAVQLYHSKIVQICIQKCNRTFWQLVWYRTIIVTVSVLQLCITTAPKTCYSYRSDIDMCVLIWYCPDATAVLIQFWKYACNRTFGNELYWIRKIFTSSIPSSYIGHLIPRPRGRKKGLVLTVCACPIIPRKRGNLFTVGNYQ